MDGNNHNGEPSTAPQPNRWYDITLGPSLKDTHSYSPRFCTLRYEFKPASIDNTQPGSLRKNRDGRVTVEFQNNQHGKPKVSFEGVSEDYKEEDRDAILCFDGETIRIEKLDRAVKRLRYVRVPGDSVTEPSYSSSPLATKTDIAQPVEMVQIDIYNPVSLEHESEEEVNIDDDDDDDDDEAKMGSMGAKEMRSGGLDIDINLPHPGEMEEDEIADVDINDDESYKGLNAAEALRAQVKAEAREEEDSSSLSSDDTSESPSIASSSSCHSRSTVSASPS